MIIGIGSDIFEVARMRRELDSDGSGLKHQLFTPREIVYCESKRYPERHFAARFAAKEALLKALATGLTPEMTWQEVEVQNKGNGQPFFVLCGKTLETASHLGVNKYFVSLSHTEEWASASVILES
jgi:holo-[acyl-carrier protein] synthase